jgi:hypothetical protein
LSMNIGIGIDRNIDSIGIGIEMLLQSFCI